MRPNSRNTGLSSRRRTIGVTVLGLAVVAGTATACGAAGNPAASAPPAPATSGAGGLAEAAQRMPQLAAGPHNAVVPAHGTASGTPTAKATPSGSLPGTPGASQAASSSASSSAAGAGAGSPGAPAAPPAGAAGCPDPQYTTSDPNGMWNQSPYFVANDAWNISGYNVSQTLHACSSSDWYVDATMDNSKGDGAVKTFPNSHRDFDNNPLISSLSSITSTFAESGPGTGIYEDAYDIWLNAGTAAKTEVMIWTDNHGQSPGGDKQTAVTLDGRSYTVWKSSTNSYIAFVANSNFSSGTVNLLDFFKWLMSQGWLASSATLGQVDYGAELVSTNGTPATFDFSNFSVNAS